MSDLKTLIIGTDHQPDVSSATAFISAANKKKHSKTSTAVLLIAQGLKEEGIAFDIFEREAQDASTECLRDCSMALQRGLSHFAACLLAELLSKLSAIHSHPFYEVEHGTMPNVTISNWGSLTSTSSSDV
jgi:hypothetical protein